MLATLLTSVVAAIVNALLGRFFPSHPQITAEAIAQAQKDKADVLQNQANARKEADVIRQSVSIPSGAPGESRPVVGGVSGSLPAQPAADPYERQ